MKRELIYTRDLVCKRCGCKKGQEKTSKPCESKKVSLCDDCKQQYLLLNKQRLLSNSLDPFLREKNSIRLKQNNPMRNEQIAKKVSKTQKQQFSLGIRKSHFNDPDIKQITIKRNKQRIRTDQQRLQSSKRMTQNNPMFNKDSLDKRTKTFKKKLASGQIKYKKGKQHHLWKGNRTFNSTVRCQLYPVWIQKCLQRDNYICQKCGQKYNLQVHHLVTLNSMIQAVALKHNIQNFNEIPSVEWQPYIDQIISMHKLEDGITLCCDCHQKEDENYYANSASRKKKKI